MNTENIISPSTSWPGREEDANGCPHPNNASKIAAPTPTPTATQLAPQLVAPTRFAHKLDAQKSPEELHLEAVARDEFETVVCSNNLYGPSGRFGTLRLKTGEGLPFIEELTGLERKLQTHQIAGARRFLLIDCDKPLHTRDVAQLWVWGTGLGKTVGAIAVIAAIAQKLALSGSTFEGKECASPSVMRHLSSDDEKTLIVVPKTMLIPWAEQISSWMTNTKTVVANHENQLTEETVLDSKIILITSGALYTAFRKGAKINLPPGKKTFDAKYVVPREGVALHPLFAFMKSRACAGRPAFSFVIHDEIHMRCNPRTWTGLITKVLSTHSPFRLGLTATPVTRDAGQMAHL